MSADDIQVGDRLVYRGGWNNDHFTISHVERITKTQVILESGLRLWKDDLSEVGSPRYNAWEPLTPQLEQEIRETRWRQSLLRRLEDTKWRSLGTSILESVVAVLDPEYQKEKGN